MPQDHLKSLCPIMPEITLRKEEIWASQVVLMVKNPPISAGDIRGGLNPWVRKIPLGRAWQSTPVFLPRESLGQRSLVGYSPWGHGVGHD